MTVDDDLVLHLAKLAKLELDERQRALLRHDLVKILAMVEKLDELELAGVPPLRYPTQAVRRLRTDRVGDHLDRHRAMENAPEAADGFFRVPRVL